MRICLFQVMAVTLGVAAGSLCCHAGEESPPAPDVADDAGDADRDDGGGAPLVDMLLVLHNPYYQGEYVGGLLGRLQSVVLPPLVSAGLDVRVGIVTADLGSGGRVFGSVNPLCGESCDREDGTSSSDEGRLVTWPPCWPEAPQWYDGECPTVFPDPRPGFASAADPQFWLWLACFGLRTDGCSVAQPFESLYQALEPGRNPGFLRDGSILAVVILTQEDDCSMSDPAVMADPVLPGGHISMCAARADHLYPVSRYVDRLLEVRDADRLVVSVFAGPDVDYPWCYAPAPEPGMGCEVCSPPETPCVYQIACSRGEVVTFVNASPRLGDFVRALGVTTSGLSVGLFAEACAALYWGDSGSAELGRLRDAILARVP